MTNKKYLQDRIKGKTISKCDRKCKTCKDMVNGFCSIIFEVK